MPLDLTPLWSYAKIKDQQQERPSSSSFKEQERSTKMGNKRCVAVLQVQQVDMPTMCRNLKYEFYAEEKEGAESSGNGPTVGQMVQELLPEELDMSMEQLVEHFELQVQIKDKELEPENVFVDLSKKRWKETHLENRAQYKVLLHPKLPSNPTTSHSCKDHEHQHLLANAKMPMKQRSEPEKANRGVQQQKEEEELKIMNDKTEGKRWESIDRFALFESANLGNLYDAHTDNFVTSHELGFMRNLVTVRTFLEQSRPSMQETIVEIDQMGNLEERMQMLEVEQKLSVLSRLADFGGDSALGQFLLAATQFGGKSPNNSFGIIHIVPKRTLTLKLNERQVRSAVLKQRHMENATHVVKTACYGSLVAAIVVQKEEQIDELDITTVKKLALMRIQKKTMSFSDSALLTSLNKGIRISVFVNPEIGTGGTEFSFMEGLDIFVDAPQRAASINPHGFGHPITFSLIPLSAIVDNSSQSLLPAPTLHDSTFYERILLYLQIVNDFEMELQKADDIVNEFAHCFTQIQWNSARQLCQRFEMLKKSFGVLLKNAVIDLRMGNVAEIEEGVEGTEQAPVHRSRTLTDLTPAADDDIDDDEAPMDALKEAVTVFQECSQHLIALCDSIMKRKVELIRQLEAKGTVYIGRGNRQLKDVLGTGNNNASTLHFVLLFYPPSDIDDEGEDDLATSMNWEQSYWQSLGQLCQMADRGMSCIFIDLELLSDDEKAVEELPDSVRAIDQFPKVGARLIKLRGDQLMTADCVQDEARKLELCIARIENTQRIDRAMCPLPNKQPCSLPCPRSRVHGGKCPNSDFVWGCDDCGQTLHFVKQPENVPITHFYCDCGRTPVDEFSFRCADVQSHGYEFTHFASKNAMERELQRLNNKGDVNLLLLGETGGGKSTLINALFNYLKYPSMEEALQMPNIDWLIPARFSTEEYDRSGYSVPKEVFIGEMNNEECLVPGQSQTRFPKAYIIPSKDGNKIRIIDAPGIGDTGGTEEDNVNFSNTLSFISELPQLHGICILLRPNHTRLSPAFKYCINGLLTYLHKNAAQNIIFVFTFARGSCYSMGKTRELLVDVLKPIEREHRVDIPLHRDRIYCMDNEAFEKLCLIKKGGVQYSQKNMEYFAESWSQAEQECQRMLEYITKLKPHRTWETVSLNEARRTIVDLAHPLALISQSIQNNLVRINDLNSTIGEGEEAEPKLETIEFIPLTFPRTVCTSARCTEVKKSGTGEVVLYKRRCHERCYLDGVVAESYPNESLKKCAAMGGGRNCTVLECGCDWSVHMHIRYDQIVVQRAIDESVLKMFADKRETLSKLEALRQQMEHERELIYAKAALFSSFLKTWALKPYNDSMEAYIMLSVQDAERLVDASEGSADHEVQQRKLEALRESLRLYKEQKEIIDKSIADSSGEQTMILPSDVKKLFEELCELPIFGKDIRQMYEAQKEARKIQQRNYSEEMAFGEKGFVPKPSRNKKVDIQVEEYLNELEKKGLESTYVDDRRGVGERRDKKRSGMGRRRHEYMQNRHHQFPNERHFAKSNSMALYGTPFNSDQNAIGGYESVSTMSSREGNQMRSVDRKLPLARTPNRHNISSPVPPYQSFREKFHRQSVAQSPSLSSHQIPDVIPSASYQKLYCQPTSSSSSTRGQIYADERRFSRRTPNMRSTSSSEGTEYEGTEVGTDRRQTESVIVQRWNELGKSRSERNKQREISVSRKAAPQSWIQRWRNKSAEDEQQKQNELIRQKK